MTRADPEKQLATLLRNLERKSVNAEHHAVVQIPDAFEHDDPIVRQLVYSLLLTDASPAKATAALDKLAFCLVDLNELRVCMCDEIVEIIGERYPDAEHRADRLRCCLNDIFQRQHCLSLAALHEVPKRQARMYLDSLEGITPLAVGRLCLLHFSAHAFPLDQYLMDVLVKEKALPENYGSLVSAVAWLERQIRAKDAKDAYIMLELHARPPKDTSATTKAADAPSSKTSTTNTK